MMDERLIPSRLVDPSERSGVKISVPRPPSRFRTWYTLARLIRLLLYLARKWLTRSLDGRDAGLRVRMFLERSGALWIRMGRIIALRSDMFSPGFCQELDKIGDLADGFPFDIARKVVDEELGKPLEAYFDSFSEKPFVAFTISQIHMAHLKREKTWVAVNVQRPFARETFSKDMRLIRRITGILGRFPSLKNMKWADLCHELEEIVQKELDSRYEASSARRLKQTLEEHDIYLYGIHAKYSSKRMLVTEFIRGALMIDFVVLNAKDPARLQRWLTRNNIKPKKLAKRLFNCVLRQVFEDNFFHGDMRATNMVLLRDSNFSVLDTRSVASNEAETLEKYRLFLKALINEEFEMAADIFFLLASVLPRVDTEEVKKDMIRMWKTWTLRAHIRDLPYDEKSLSYMFAQVNAIVLRYQFAVQWSALHLFRALANMENIVQHLAPETNVIEWIRRYFDDAKKRESIRAVEEAPITAMRLISKVREMPQRLAGYALFQDIVIRRQTQIVSGSTAKAGYVLGSLAGFAALVFFVGGLILGAEFLSRHHGLSLESTLGHQLSQITAPIPAIPYVAWFGVLGMMAYLWSFNRKMSRKFRAKDVRTPQSGGGG